MAVGRFSSGSNSPLGRGFLTGAFQKPEGLDAGDYRRTDPRFSSANFASNLKLVEIVSENALSFLVRLDDVQFERLYGILREQPVIGARSTAASMAAIDA